MMWKVGERTQAARPAGSAPGPGSAGRWPSTRATGQPAPARRRPAKPAVKETTETLLADCFFLGPPLPLAGKLYVVIEKDGDLRLVCLDPAKMEKSARSADPGVPTLVWSQVLGQPNGRLPQDSFRRFQGIHLAYADGILVVPTNAGAVLGIDLFSHSLVWAANYKSNKTAQQADDGRDDGRPRVPRRRSSRCRQRRAGLRDQPGAVARRVPDHRRQQGRVHGLRLGHGRVRRPARRPAGLEDPDRQAGGRPVRGRGVRRQGDDRRQGVRPVPQPATRGPDQGRRSRPGSRPGIGAATARPVLPARSRRPRTRATSRASSPSTPRPCRSRGPAGRGRRRRPATCSSTRATSTP